MSQRSYTNDRYRKGALTGSTRKSAARAKPVRAQGTVEPVKRAAPKKRGGEVEKDWAGLPTSPAIKKWRNAWWVLLLVGLALVVAAYVVPGLRANEEAQRIIAPAVLVLSLSAVGIDLFVIRPLRKDLMSTAAKPSRKQQKHAAEADAAAAGGKGSA